MRRIALFVVCVAAAACSGNNKPASESTAPVGSSEPALSSATVGKPIEVARRTFRATPSGFLAGSRSHSAVVRSDGTMAFTPILRADGRARLKPVSGAALELRTVELGRDTTVATSATPKLDGERVALEHGLAVERWATALNGVEQSWHLATRPEGEGDFVVRVSATGQAFVSATGTGLHFSDAAQGVGVKYGVATFIDAADKRTEIMPRWVDGQIVLTVPADVIDHAAYPAVLDPAVSAEQTVDSAGGLSESDVAVAYGNNFYLVTWIDGTPRGAIVARNGTPSAPFVIASGVSPISMDVSFESGANFISCWTNGTKVSCARIDTSGAVATPSAPFDVVTPGSFTSNLHQATAGETMIVYNVGSASNYNVHASTVPVGATSAGINFNITNDANINFDPAVAGIPGATANFLVTYTNEGSGAVFSKHVLIDGTVGVAQQLTNFPVDSVHVGGAGNTFMVEFTNSSSSATALRGFRVDRSTGVPLSSQNGFAVYSGFNVVPGRVTWDGYNFAFPTSSATRPVMAYASAAGAVLGSVNGPTADGTFNISSAASDGTGHALMAYISSPGISALLFSNLPNGATCTTSNECGSGNCVGGICCAVACTDPNTTFTCPSGSACVVNGCLNGFSNCDGVASNGCETNTTDNATGTNCGGCGAAFTCSTTNASGATCSGGVCVPSCNGGFAHCTGSPLTSGCETDITTLTNCGACGNTCGAPGACQAESCSPLTGSLTCQAIPQIQCGVPNCGLGGCSGADTDGDGLQDAWETQGYVDVNCNGVNDGEGVDVQLPGADVNVPDVYVEVDYLQKAGSGAACSVDADCAAVTGEQCIGGACTHTHRPKDTSLNAVVTAMRRGENPTSGLPPIDPSRRGVRLHLDATHMNSIDETATNALVVSMGTTPGSRVLDTACVGSTAANFFDLKDANFYGSGAYRDARKRVYHYAIFGHYSSCPPGPPGTPEQYCSLCPADRSGSTPLSGASGTSEKPGNDFIVSLGATYFDTGVPRSDTNEGGTFLHELGHNLGLDHGVALVGATPVPAAGPIKSPNYLSVMNYNYQLSGVLYTSGGSPATKIDLADTRCTVDLNESALDETAGAGCGPSSPYLLRYFAVSGPAKVASGADGSAINWNGSTSPVIDSGTVTVDLNRNTFTTDVHRSLNDWAYTGGKFTNLSFEMGCLPWTLTDGLPPVEARSSNELTPTQAIELGAATPPRTDVSVEVRPGCPTHWIALSSPTQVPIAIYSSATFDASKLVPSTLVFAGENVASTSVADVNGDGRLDLIANFVMSGLAIPAGATSALLSGSLPNGTAMLVSATFTLVPSAGPVLVPKADANGYSGTMWSVNNQTQNWDLTACITSATDRCGNSVSVLSNGQITKITNDEKGNNQMFITGNATFSLAKNRDGQGDGRVYTVYYTIRDSLGNGTPGTCKFEVRHDNPGVPAIDSGTKTCVGNCP